MVFDFDISFYKGDPILGGELLHTERIDHSMSTIPMTGCMITSQIVEVGSYDLHVYVNDKGTKPTDAPVVLMPECDTTNNSVSYLMNDCSVADLITVDSITICAGDTAIVQAENSNNYIWSGLEPFVQISDSVIQVSPAVTSTFYVSSFRKEQNFLTNSDFEDPDLEGWGVKFVDANDVAGWSTTDAQNEIEVWSSASGVAAYSGDQFIELNAHDDAALFQDIATVPGSKLLWSFAHRGRNGTDEMLFEVGAPGGTFTQIGRYRDGNTSWGVHAGVYEIPAGQTTTRFYFTAVTGLSLIHI